MSSPFSSKSAADIRGRLLEIRREEERHAARDLDAELAEVMAAGGDLDAIEAKHLDAERVMRRLRVERRALEAALPEAERRAGAAAVAKFAEEHETLAKAAQAAAVAAVAAWQRFRQDLTSFAGHQAEASRLTHAADQAASNSGAEMPMMGMFNSAALTAVLADLNEADADIRRTLASADQRMHVGKNWTLMARPIDGPQAANDQAA